MVRSLLQCHVAAFVQSVSFVQLVVLSAQIALICLPRADCCAADPGIRVIFWGCVNGNAERRKDKDFELQFNPSKSRLSCFARILVVEDCLEIKKVAGYG